MRSAVHPTQSQVHCRSLSLQRLRVTLEDRGWPIPISYYLTLCLFVNLIVREVRNAECTDTLAMLGYLNLYTHVLVYLNLCTHVLPKFKYLKIQDPIPSALGLIHQYTKPKSPKTKIRALLPVGPKGNPRGNAAAVTTSRLWHLPSIFYLRQDTGRSPPCPTRVALFSKQRKRGTP